MHDRVLLCLFDHFWLVGEYVCALMFGSGSFPFRGVSSTPQWLAVAEVEQGKHVCPSSLSCYLCSEAMYPPCMMHTMAKVIYTLPTAITSDQQIKPHHHHNICIEIQETQYLPSLPPLPSDQLIHQVIISLFVGCCFCAHLQSWLKQPLVDVSAISARHDMVEAMVEDPELRGRLRDQHLRGEWEWC